MVDTFADTLVACDFPHLPITIDHALRAGLLEGDHKDPFDRMLVAQAIAEDLVLVTVDPKLSQLGASVLW